MARSGTPRMSDIWAWRRAITAGYSVKDIEKKSGYSASTIRKYTVAEREDAKRAKAEDRYYEEAKRAIEDAHRMEAENRINQYKLTGW